MIKLLRGGYMSIKRYGPFIIFFYIFAVIALICASAWDLPLDMKLNNPDSLFAIWFRNTGEIPSRLIPVLAGAVLVKTCEKKIQRLCGYIICMGGSAYLGYHMAQYFFAADKNHMQPEDIAFGILYGIGVGVITLMVIRLIHIPKAMAAPLRRIAVICIIVMFAQIIIVEGSKYLWGRVRFRDLLKAGSYDSFTPWYHPNGINGNKSFPSGHTAGAGMSFTMMFLPYISKKWRKKGEVLCFLLPFIYTCTVGFTRLIMGAHYLSDITVGAVISFTVVIIAIKLYEKKFGRG